MKLSVQRIYVLSRNGTDVYHYIRESRSVIRSKVDKGAATGQNNFQIGTNNAHQRGDSISMNSLLRGAVGEDVRYELRTSIACVMMVSEALARAERACLKPDKIAIGRAHVVYQQLPCTFILFWEFYSALHDFCYRPSLGTGCLQEGPLPPMWLGTLILAVLNDIGLDFILHKRQEGFCPSRKLSGNNER